MGYNARKKPGKTGPFRGLYPRGKGEKTVSHPDRRRRGCIPPGLSPLPPCISPPGVPMAPPVSIAHERRPPCYHKGPAHRPVYRIPLLETRPAWYQARGAIWSRKPGAGGTWGRVAIAGGVHESGRGVLSFQGAGGYRAGGRPHGGGACTVYRGRRGGYDGGRPHARGGGPVV